MSRMTHAFLTALLGIVFLNISAADEGTPIREQPWKRHIIDDSSQGADGARLADVNRDGRLDIVTGWEEGGITRVYLHPGFDKAKVAWPAVTVGKTSSVEDAVFCDIDGDGAVDVVSACEGETKSLFVHWAPKQPQSYLTPDAWTTEVIPVTQGMTQWMFTLPQQIDGENGVDFVLGSKGSDAVIGWLKSPENPRDLAAWNFYPLYKAGWIMSLMSEDVDSDGDLDILASDRRGENSGVLWLENPGANAVENVWPEHRIGVSGREVMFLDVTDLDSDGRRDVVAAVKKDEIHWFRHPPDPTQLWPSQIIRVDFPPGTGPAKAVKAGDIDGNGSLDLVYSCESADPPKSGVVWLRYNQSPFDHTWTAHDLSGPEGIKFDLIQLVDVDGDGDPDVLTCEERHMNRGLGVFWYENPFQ